LRFRFDRLIEVVSQPRITPEGKAQADSKAQHTWQYVSISRGLQRRQRASDGVMKPLLIIKGFPEPSQAPLTAPQSPGGAFFP
jgi:hypothetical protein